MSLTLRLAKISPTHHRFQYVRSDGSGESLELETKTFLLHDFLHFAVESEAGLHNSFYGLLDTKAYGELMPEKGKTNQYWGDEIRMTERVVGVFTSLIKNEAKPEDILAGVKNLSEANNEEVPVWLSLDFISRVKERMRKLMGEWQKLPFGEEMILIFPQK